MKTLPYIKRAKLKLAFENHSAHITVLKVSSCAPFVTRSTQFGYSHNSRKTTAERLFIAHSTEELLILHMNLTSLCKERTELYEWSGRVFV